MSDKEDNSIYKLIVIVATGLLIVWFFGAIEVKLAGYSAVLGFIVGPILIYATYKIMKGIWPDL